jgi:hypothetical protein
MAKGRHVTREPTVIERVLEAREASLLDVLDHVLDKGVMATGDLTLGVAGVDLIYVRLGALLCAVDRVLPSAQGRTARSPKSRLTATRSQTSRRRPVRKRS